MSQHFKKNFNLHSFENILDTTSIVATVMNVKFVEEKQQKNCTETQYIFRILRFLITWVAKEECECEKKLWISANYWVAGTFL